MNILSSVLPGFRHLRAPLVSGYIWLLALWLALAGNLPTAETNETYARIFELGDAVGPVGIGIAVSVVAYILGSLIQAMFALIRRQVIWPIGRALRRQKESKGRPGQRERGIHEVVGSKYYEPVRVSLLDRSKSITELLQWLEQQECTGQAMKKLEQAIERACEKASEAAGTPNARPRVELKSSLAEHEIVLGDGDSSDSRPVPTLVVERDVLGDRNVIQSRLMESKQYVGEKIDRVYSESEFRFAIAWPLAAMSIVLATRLSAEWGLLALVPLGLVAHGIGLHREGNRELLDALRTSDKREDLTTAYTRYRQRAAELGTYIGQVDWARSENYFEPDGSLGTNVDDGARSRPASQA